MVKKRILFIEDDKNLLLNTKELLEEEGYSVITAVDGVTGVETAYKLNPDIIICDISLPIKNGYQVLKEVLNNEKTKRIPFIFLTAKSEINDFRYGMLLGADDYIFKPFNIEDLICSIKIRLEKSYNLLNTSAELVNEKKKKYQIDDKIMISKAKKMQLVIIKDIKLIKAASPYTNIKFINGNSVLMRETISGWEEKLPSKIFVRIHRALIINSDYIIKIEKLNSSSYLLQLRDESESFTVSKRYSAKLREHFS